MKAHSPSRRRTLQQLVGLTALGAINALRLPRSLAADQPERLSIAGISGKIIRRQDPDYELWRQSMVWHMSKPKRYPDLIVQASSDSDVSEAVRYAAGKHMKVATRAGGHNSTGSSLRDGGLLIDLSAMGGIEIDESRQIASIQPGVRSLDLITAARKKGLSFPVPHCPSVGLAGFTLGGGIGWNYPQRGGMSTFSIAGADVVTAEGRQLHVTPDKNPDLYWSMRGAGPGFFGAVTRLELELYPLPTAIAASSYIFPLSELETVTTTLDAIRKEHDVGRVEVLVVLMHHPDAPADAPAEQAKICFFTAFAFEDSEQEAHRVLAPFAQSELATKCLVKMENQPFDFEGLYERYFSLKDPAGRCARYAVDNVLTNQGGSTLQALAQYFLAAPTRDSHILAAFNMHTRTRPDSCFSWDIDCYLGCYTIWDDEQDDERVFSWLDGTQPLMDPFAEGHYVNEIEGRRHPDRYRLCFSESNWQRLGQMRQQYDPTGVFHDFLGSS